MLASAFGKKIMDSQKLIKMKVRMTPLQKKVFDMYVLDELSVVQISEKIYGSKTRSGDISIILRAVSKKVGVPLTTRFRKYENSRTFELEMKHLKKLSKFYQEDTKTLKRKAMMCKKA